MPSSLELSNWALAELSSLDEERQDIIWAEIEAFGARISSMIERAKKQKATDDTPTRCYDAIAHVYTGTVWEVQQADAMFAGLMMLRFKRSAAYVGVYLAQGRWAVCYHIERHRKLVENNAQYLSRWQMANAFLDANAPVSE